MICCPLIWTSVPLGSHLHRCTTFQTLDMCRSRKVKLSILKESETLYYKASRVRKNWVLILCVLLSKVCDHRHDLRLHRWSCAGHQVTQVNLCAELLNMENWVTLQYVWASLKPQLVKKLPVMQETPLQSLGWEDPLEKGNVTHSSTLAWRIPWTV